ncbi:MAG: PIN domain-containing protein [Acidobacteriota bacterium]
MVFADTNILLYSISVNPLETAKREIARQILTSRHSAISVQVLQEFYWQATRGKERPTLTAWEARQAIERFCEMNLQDMTARLFRSALATTERYQIAYWDAAIIEAARALGCHTVLSEDLQQGQDYGGVRVENPFL